MATEPSPATSETRVPQITRESTSRPTLSVPRRWARPGLARTLPRSCLRGSWGDTMGASTATMSAASITTTPRGARRVRAACRSTTHRRSRTGTEVAAHTMTGAGSAISDPRIDPAIEEIHEQVAQDEADGDEQDHALHERIVAREDGVHHQAPHAGEGEDVLGDDGAADQGAELEAEHRDHGNQSVFQHVTTDHPPLRESLGPRRADIVLRERLQHAGAERARNHGGQSQPQGDGGQHERAQAQPRLLQGVGVARDGEPAKLHAEEEDEEEGEEEVGHADAEEGERGANAVDGGIAAGGGENPD